MNGNLKIGWILGACVVAGAAYWLYAQQAASDASGGAGSGDGTGDQSDGSSTSAASLLDNASATILSGLQSIGQSLGIVQAKGIRNNNPGNLRYVASIPWKGQTGDDGTGYAVFDTAEDGIRALGHQLATYISRGENTVTLVIQTYAPDTENNTAAYINDVATRMGVDVNQPFDTGAIPSLAQAIIIHENGSDPYGIDSIAAWSTEA